MWRGLERYGGMLLAYSSDVLNKRLTLRQVTKPMTSAMERSSRDLQITHWHAGWMFLWPCFICLIFAGQSAMRKKWVWSSDVSLNNWGAMQMHHICLSNPDYVEKGLRLFVQCEIAQLSFFFGGPYPFTPSHLKCLAPSSTVPNGTCESIINALHGLLTGHALYLEALCQRRSLKCL